MARRVRVACFFLWMLPYEGCTISTTPPGGAPDGGTGGSSDLCVMACTKLDALMCASTTQGDCATHCGIPARCKVEENALAQCILAADVMCDASGNASTSACNMEGLAFLQCAFPDGGVR